MVEDALAPYDCGDYDILINVRAASVQLIDAEICSGYGRIWREILGVTYKVRVVLNSNIQLKHWGLIQSCFSKYINL